MKSKSKYIIIVPKKRLVQLFKAIVPLADPLKYFSMFTVTEFHF